MGRSIGRRVEKSERIVEVPTVIILRLPFRVLAADDRSAVIAILRIEVQKVQAVLSRPSARIEDDRGHLNLIMQGAFEHTYAEVGVQHLGLSQEDDRRGPL